MGQCKWFPVVWRVLSQPVISTSALYVGGSGLKSQYGDLGPAWTNFMESHLRTWWQGCTNREWRVAVTSQLYAETPNICSMSMFWHLEVWGGSYIFGKNLAPLPNRSSAGEDIPYVWWNPKVHYHVYKSPPLVCTLSQINPVHTLAACFCKMSLVWTLSIDKFTFLVCDGQLFMFYWYS